MELSNGGMTVKKKDGAYDRFIFGNKVLAKGVHRWSITLDSYNEYRIFDSLPFQE